MNELARSLMFTPALTRSSYKFSNIDLPRALFSISFSFLLFLIHWPLTYYVAYMQSNEMKIEIGVSHTTPGRMKSCNKSKRGARKKNNRMTK